MKTSDLHFTLNDWEKRQRHYWQPVLYFKQKNDKHHGVDFCMAAKNACSSMKMFMTWVEDKNYKTSDRHKKEAKNWFIQHNKEWSDEDESIYQQYAFDGHFSTRRISRVKRWQNQDTDMTTFFRNDALKKFCIKRDPIQRFLSGYIHTHKDTGPAWHGLHDYSIDGFIDRIRDGEYWNEHLESQTFWMGHPSWYDEVFEMKDVKKCMKCIADIIGEKHPIPEFHYMKNSHPKPSLTRAQIYKIEELYIEDYENGWY